MSNEEILNLAREALSEIVLAGMSGSGQESEEGMRDFRARQAWKFIRIAAKAKTDIDAAIAARAEAQPEGWKKIGDGITIQVGPWREVSSNPDGTIGVTPEMIAEDLEAMRRAQAAPAAVGREVPTELRAWVAAGRAYIQAREAYNARWLIAKQAPFGAIDLNLEFQADTKAQNEWHGLHLPTLKAVEAWIDALATPAAEVAACLTCNDSGSVGLVDYAEPCPECSLQGFFAAAAMRAEKESGHD